MSLKAKSLIGTRIKTRAMQEYERELMKNKVIDKEYKVDKAVKSEGHIFCDWEGIGTTRRSSGVEMPLKDVPYKSRH